MSKTKVKFNKPIAIGMTILELSKIVMYEYLYDIFPQVFGPGNVELLYMDTDSFIINVKSKDVYVQIKEHLNVFDTSDYPETHPCFLWKERNNLVL